MRKHLTLIVLMIAALTPAYQAQATGGYRLTVYLNPDEGQSGVETLVMVRAKPEVVGRKEYTEVLYLYIFFDGINLVERVPSKKVGELYAYSWDATVMIPESTMGNHTIEVWLEYSTGKFSKCEATFTVTDSPFIEVIQGEKGEPGERGLRGKPGVGTVGPEGPPGETVIGPQGPPGESVIGPQGLPGDVPEIIGKRSLISFDLSRISLVFSIISILVVIALAGGLSRK